MALEAYRAKRDFTATAEPRGRKARAKGNSFVIQKHDATRLHYDLRLEMDGVLKSWAVTKGPSLVPGEKRLAVHVEDHPLDYAGFEGSIPKGQYGAGEVIVWDRGTWEPVEDAHRGYAKGHLEFLLNGEKLHGAWHLVRMRGKPSETRENWLLIKAEDAFARDEGDPDILEERPESVLSGRRLGKPPAQGRKPATAGKGARRAKGAGKAAMPDFVPPMLASLVSAAPSGAGWLHEIKFDGYRLQAHLTADNVRLLTRSGLDWTERFGKNLPAALKSLPARTAILDGELVVETGSGASDFSALQADLSEGRSDRFVLYTFDLLHLDGKDLRALPLEERKTLLQQLLPDLPGPVRFSGHFDEAGSMVLRHACRLSLEGIVSKKRDAPYRSGRGKAWLKSKCSARQEFVIGGFVPSTVSRSAVGSLVLGVQDGGKLRHVGRVGTGFTTAVAADLFRRLERQATPDSPFDPPLAAAEARQVRFVRPNLVAEVEFRAWTADGHLRHAAFRGLREDKDAREVVAERASRSTSTPPAQRRTVKLTHPDRLYWPEDGVTKEGLADYYAEVWRHIAPFVAGRPLALLRAPEGIDGKTFFQKHVWKGLDRHILAVNDPKSPKEQPLVAITDLDGLLGLVQAAVLEIHPWGSTLAEWEKPDMLVMDLDPGEDVPWQRVIEAALEVRARLADFGLASFVKTSGGKGLHVVVPLKPSAHWPAVKAFTKALADSMAADTPDRFVSVIAKSKRRGKILIDYLRNQRGATAVAAYSTRARPGAPVSAPLAWDELSPAIGPAYFTVQNMPARLAALAADPWSGFRDAAAPLEPRRRTG